MSRSRRVFVAVTALVVLALAAAPFLVPLDFYRARIEAAASQATGRDVRIRGPLHFTLIPELGVSAEDVVVANVAGARDPDFAEVSDLVLGAKFWPLLSGRLDVTELVLDQAVLHLETNKDGTPNWQLAAENNRAASESAKDAAPSRFAIRALKIADGQLTYYSAASGRSLALSSIELSLAIGAAGEPIGVKGSLVYDGQEFKLDGTTRHGPDDAIASAGTITSGLFSARWSGDVRVPGNSAGDIDIRAASLSKALAWAGHEIGFGDQPFALRAHFEKAGDRISLGKMNLTLGPAAMSGDLVLDSGAPTPALSGDIAIGNLDTRSFTAAGENRKTPAAVADTAPIKLEFLKQANADLKIALAHIVTEDFAIESAVLAVKSTDGLLTVDLGELAFYGGKGKASFVIDDRGKAPVFRQAIHVTNIQVRPFLSDLIGSGRVDGQAAIDLDVKAQGATRAEIWNSLSGKASLTLKNGTIRGVDLAAISRLVQDIVTTQILNVVGDREQTKFAEMSAGFVIQNGVAHTKDFTLTNSVLKMTGQGDIDLAHHALDVRLQPQATPSLPIPDIGIPFRISGPWDKPRYGPDMKNLAKGLAQGLVKQPLETLSNPGKALKSLLGLGR